MQEIWKDVPGYENMYQVSNLGNVKSLERFVKTKKGYSFKINEKILSINKDRYGYLSSLLAINATKKLFKNHRLVAMAFIPNPENKPQVNHINGIKYDNKLENLEWCTQSENQKHAYKNGLQKNMVGCENYNSKLKNEDVYAIKQDNRSDAKIAKDYNVSKTLIYKIKHNQLWKHI
jgi:hypothetical protein